VVGAEIGAPGPESLDAVSGSANPAAATSPASSEPLTSESSEFSVAAGANAKVASIIVGGGSTSSAAVAGSAGTTAASESSVWPVVTFTRLGDCFRSDLEAAGALVEAAGGMGDAGPFACVSSSGLLLINIIERLFRIGLGEYFNGAVRCRAPRWTSSWSDMTICCEWCAVRAAGPLWTQRVWASR
jgi:hypothetical protein